MNPNTGPATAPVNPYTDPALLKPRVKMTKA
jgi:hypothetical protein